MQNTAERNPEEVAEIERHKYFLSEKAGHDVGWDVAAQDWDEKFAADFRDTNCSSESSNCESQGACSNGNPSTGGISMLFKRLFSR